MFDYRVTLTRLFLALVSGYYTCSDKSGLKPCFHLYLSNFLIPLSLLFSSIKQEQNNYYDSRSIWGDGRVPGKARDMWKTLTKPHCGLTLN